MTRPRLTLDTETDLIQPGLQAPSLACVSFWSGGAGTLCHGQFDRQWLDILVPALQDPDLLLCGHGVAFDFCVLGNEVPALMPLIFKAYEDDRVIDTEVNQKLLDIAAGIYREFTDEDEDGEVAKITYELGDLSWRLLRRKLDKDTWRLRYGELIPYPLDAWPEGSRVYPVEDSHATDDIATLQEDPRCAEYLRDRYRQARAAFWLRLMANWGLRTDPQGIFELEDLTRKQYGLIAKGDLWGIQTTPDGKQYKLKGMSHWEDIPKSLTSVGLLRPDRQVKRRATGLVETEPGSRNTTLAKDRMIEAMARLGKEVKLTKKGQVCLEAQLCEDSGDPVLVSYARLTSLKTVLSKDIPMLAAGVHTPIHSRFEVLLDTGRTSSRKPNVQNPRRLPGVRECFTPACLRCGLLHTPEVAARGRCPMCGGPICVYISADFGGLELYTLSQVCYSEFHYSALGDALNEGKDPHLMVAANITNWPYETLVSLKNQGAGSDCLQATSVACKCPYHIQDDTRQTGKVLNFGCGGGLGAESLVAFALGNYGVRLTVDQAADLIKLWRRTWPEMADYFRMINSLVGAQFPIIKHLFSDRYRGGVKYTEAANSFFQGLGADIAKAAGWEITKGLYVDRSSPLFGGRMVNFIHDEFLIVVPEPQAHEAALDLSRRMIEASKPWLPNHKKPIKAAPMVTRRWCKDAKPVKKDGRLIPWEPKLAA